MRFSIVSTSPYIYHVIRETEDDHSYSGTHNEFIDSFWTAREANEAVSAHLYSQCDPDFFEDYEETKGQDGLVTVRATCPEGKVMTVYVQMLPVPRGEPPASLRDSLCAGPSTHVWIVLITLFEDESDKIGRQSIWRNIVYDSAITADASAVDALLEVCGEQDIRNIRDLYEITERDSENEGYRARAVLRSEGIHAAGVEVKRVSILTTASKKRKPASGDETNSASESSTESGSESNSEPDRKRLRTESSFGRAEPEIIEILSDSD